MKHGVSELLGTDESSDPKTAHEHRVGRPVFHVNRDKGATGSWAARWQNREDAPGDEGVRYLAFAIVLLVQA